MADARPDPDQLLERIRQDEARARRGRLKIFFGASAGVGKTYSMLEAARGMQAAGTDVVVGYIEPHGRIETERLLEGLPRLPPLAVSHRGIVRHEFDLDAALARRPEILLVDELAHSNLTGGEPPPRHPKRWQDIEELLAAGISVWTTVNVQHLESLNDLIFQTTGVRQRETLPDHVFDEADDIELIDLPPDDLIARLRAGKVYVGDQVGTAIERFFRKQNLMALREIALRRVADRVEAAARALPATEGTQGRIAGDRVMVAVGPDEQAAELVRAGKRMADALDAEWTVVYVETPALLRLSDAARNRRIDVLRLAESLGGESVTLDGPSAAATLAEYARVRNATRLIVGAPKRRGLSRWLRPSTATDLVRRARGFDVVLIAPGDRGASGDRGTSGDRARSPTAVQPAAAASGPGAAPGVGAGVIRWDRYVAAGAISALCTLVAFAMYRRFELSNLVMIYLLGVTVAGLRLGRGPSALTAVLNVAAFDFFFVPPRYSFAVSDVQYLVTFGTMVTIALVIANLTASVRQQTRVAGARERRTALLYAMSRELAVTRGIDNMARVAVRHVAEVFQCRAVVLLPAASGKLHYPGEPPLESSFRHADLAVAQWVAGHGRPAGLGTDTLPAAPGQYLPLGEEGRTVGVLGVLPNNVRRVLLPEQSHLLSTFAGQIAFALERARLAEVAEASSLAAERETLRNTLLASISHDLRTPLAVMAAAGSTLAQHGAKLDEATRVALASSVETKAREMSELVSNVLDLVRLESGQVALRRDWQTLDDLLGSALAACAERLAAHRIELRLSPDVPPVWVDATLIVQVLTNLFDNIAKYTPAGTHVVVSAMTEPERSFVRVTVDDEGPGLPAGDPARLFEKFQRGSDEGAVVGVGLGLAICQAIVRAHGGEIEAHRRESGGARFTFTLPAREGAV
ncbi:MAG: sensor histidine kinase KdpD [Gammaproteobacteria bacterium]|nr:sensor histidine kinase KdpD [Gammaproteobacteria bacterium]MBV9724874.1 sensor histidine kinase KdpD [Gammaproteobacteria bacterium]